MRFLGTYEYHKTYEWWYNLLRRTIKAEQIKQATALTAQIKPIYSVQIAFTSQLFNNHFERWHAFLFCVLKNTHMPNHNKNMNLLFL